jgi:ketosteroid isomerase-like protein
MVSKTLVLFALLTLNAILPSCAPAPPAGISDADEAAIREVSDSFLEKALAKDWDALAGLYTEDATLMPPNMPAQSGGRASLKAFFESFPAISDMRFELDDIDGIGNLAYVRGRYEMSLAVEGAPEPVPDRGKFVEIRRKQPDGRWLIAVDIFNSDLAPPMPSLPADEPAR